VLKRLPRRILFSAAPYPARQIAPIADTLASDLTKYSWWGRSVVHIREEEERKLHLESLLLGIKLEVNAIDERKCKLEAEKRAVARTTAMFQQMKEDLRTKQAEEDALRNEIRQADNAVLRGGREYKDRLKKGASKTGGGRHDSRFADPSSG
jgi:hypothetical protein